MDDLMATAWALLALLLWTLILGVVVGSIWQKQRNRKRNEQRYTHAPYYLSNPDQWTDGLIDKAKQYGAIKPLEDVSPGVQVTTHDQSGSAQLGRQAHKDAQRIRVHRSKDSEDHS